MSPRPGSSSRCRTGRSGSSTRTAFAPPRPPPAPTTSRMPTAPSATPLRDGWPRCRPSLRTAAASACALGRSLRLVGPAVGPPERLSWRRPPARCGAWSVGRWPAAGRQTAPRSELYAAFWAAEGSAGAVRVVTECEYVYVGRCAAHRAGLRLACHSCIGCRPIRPRPGDGVSPTAHIPWWMLPRAPGRERVDGPGDQACAPTTGCGGSCPGAPHGRHSKWHIQAVACRKCDPHDGAPHRGSGEVASGSAGGVQGRTAE